MEPEREPADQPTKPNTERVYAHVCPLDVVDAQEIAGLGSLSYSLMYTKIPPEYWGWNIALADGPDAGVCTGGA